MRRLVVLGSVNADHVLRVPTFPRPGETLTGHSYQVVPGGKGANQAVAAARLGATVDFIARIGQDPVGQAMRQGFAADGIEVSGVLCDEHLPTGIAIIYVNDAGENSIGISAEANSRLTAAAVRTHSDVISAADTLLLQLETPLDGVMEAARIAQESGTRVVLNPAPAKPLPADLLARVDLITPNQTEAQMLTGICVTDEASARDAAAALHAMGIAQVMITLGAQGVYCSDASDARLIPGFRVQALDTTAAGDTFNGAFLAASLSGQAFAPAVRFAHAAAALCVTRAGAQSSIPSSSEVQAFLAAQA
ncbi:MAG: ribokinase [Aeromonas sp.]